MAEDQIEELAKKIRRHRRLYYRGEAEIEDEVYDALEDELRRLDPEHQLVTDVGFKPSGKTKWEKKKHIIPMGSLNKAQDLEQLSDWFKSTTGAASIGDASVKSDLLHWSEKMDGISIALHYQDGKLVSAITRGDGEIGEDILANVVMMQGVPREIDIGFNKAKPITGVFRGEIVLTHDYFEQHFQDYSNPRNAASGIARREDRRKAQNCQYLTVYVYEAFVDGHSFDNETEKYTFIDQCNFKVPNHGGPMTLQEIDGLYKAYEGGHRDELFYDIDGLVVRLFDSAHYDRAGSRSNRPHGSVALKFAAETAITTLREVRWQVGDSGRITPVAEFDPVELVGAEVARASLYNETYVRELGVDVGDQILVKRANDVIPRVEKVVSKHYETTIGGGPKECPECQAPTEKDGEHLICTGAACPAQVAGDIKAWVDTLDLMDWGEFIVDELVEQGLVQSIPDLYELDPQDIASLRNSGDAKVGMKVASKLTDKLEDKTEVFLDQFIGGLNFHLCRSRTTRKMMEGGFKTLEDLRTASVSDLEKVEGIGGKKAQSMVNGLQEKADIIERLLDHVKIVEQGGPLDGLSFCITGRLSKSRKLIQKEIKDLGGVSKSGVSKSLDYLVCNNKESSSSKAKKARRYDIPLISEEELQKMME